MRYTIPYFEWDIEVTFGYDTNTSPFISGVEVRRDDPGIFDQAWNKVDWATVFAHAWSKYRADNPSQS